MPHVDEKLSQTVRKFLSDHPMGVLSTASSEALPWGAAIYYCADDNFNFYFVTRTGTQKSQFIEENAQAALTVADQTTQSTVQLSGKVTKVSPEEYESVVFEKLQSARPNAGKSSVPPLEKIHDGNYVAYRLIPSNLKYANYSVQKTDPRASYAQKLI